MKIEVISSWCEINYHNTCLAFHYDFKHKNNCDCRCHKIK